MKLKKLDIFLISIFLLTFLYFFYIKFLKENPKSVTINNKVKTQLFIQPDTIIDLGTIQSNSIQEFKIKVTNIGSNELKIRDFTSSCGCTKIKCEQTNIKVGDSTIISGKLDTKNKYGPNISGIRFKANTAQGFHSISINYTAKK
jgi:hypothetical protein